MTRAGLILGGRHERLQDGARVRHITVARPSKCHQLLLESLQRPDALLDQRDVVVEKLVDLRTGLIRRRGKLEQLPHVR